MKLQTLKRHLSPYGIYAKRATTVNHAFASALAPVDEWDLDRAAGAMALLDQDDLNNLSCVYCRGKAQTWDHLEPMVRQSLPSGYGHTLGNLVPSCRDCNSSKGNRPWRDWVASWSKAPVRTLEMLESYASAYLPEQRTVESLAEDFPKEMEALRIVWDGILEAMKEADSIVNAMRSSQA